MARDTQSSLHGARLTLCTSRRKLAMQMGPKNMTLPQPGKPFFDYGCQYISVSSDWLIAELELWKKLGFCQVLPENEVGTISSQGFQALPGDCWVGNGGMPPMLRNIHRQTAQEFEDVLEQVSGFPNDAYKVVGLRKDTSGQWELQMQGGGTLGPFTYVVGGFAQHILTDPFRVESNQLIVMQVSFEGEPLPIPFTAAHVCDDEALSFIGNNSQKPQQNGEWGTPGPQQLTLISTAEFAEREFNCNGEAPSILGPAPEGGRLAVQAPNQPDKPLGGWPAEQHSTSFQRLSLRCKGGSRLVRGLLCRSGRGRGCKIWCCHG